MSRNYSNNAVQTTLSGAINASDTTVSVSVTTGFPTAPFILAIDADTANQELVLVTAVGGLNLTVERGYDNTTAVSHDVGAVVRHSHAAKDFADSRTHESATAAHGATGAVVGTTNAQTLSNKTIALGSNTVSGTKAQFNTAITDADLASLAGTETLTNKTLALGSNTVSGTKAEFNTALTDGDFASLAGTETLTNKTIGVTNAVTGVVPIGCWLPYGGATAPDANWLICNGAAVSRTTYAGLFAVLGTMWGAGDGSTTFNIPSLIDRTTVGAGGHYLRGDDGGADEINLTTAQLPAHTHTINHDHETQHNTSDGSSVNVIKSASSTGFSTADTNQVAAFSGNSGSTGSGSAIDIQNPFTAAHYIIRAL